MMIDLTSLKTAPCFYYDSLNRKLQSDAEKILTYLRAQDGGVELEAIASYFGIRRGEVDFFSARLRTLRLLLERLVLLGYVSRKADLFMAVP